jgi:hypothetical protein
MVNSVLPGQLCILLQVHLLSNSPIVTTQNISPSMTYILAHTFNREPSGARSPILTILTAWSTFGIFFLPSISPLSSQGRIQSIGPAFTTLSFDREASAATTTRPSAAVVRQRLWLARGICWKLCDHPS